MHKPTLAMIALAVAACTGAFAQDMLPLKQGLYVPANRPCKGASNAEIVNYWGGKSSFGSAQATCTISTLTRNGKVFTITDKCVDIQGGGEIVGGPTVVTIANPTSFTLAGQTYRYCGTKVQF
ncbi:MAG: hypothetical protein IAE86_02965 [Burkholderiaceae bacterium]|nr:hypothetical protein [Burkholderiaceae bacterium]